MAKAKKKFKFEISLSVLNHLGRNLYRNFITVLGEAISNAWDADANNVWIQIDKENRTFSIKDDGTGMNAEDFQSKFLKVGYSKRSHGAMRTRGGRPFIGAKGIGKLALLSCAKRVSVFTRKRNQPYVGGVIDNSALDKAIKSELAPGKYSLGSIELDMIDKLRKGHDKGTILIFEETKEHIRNSVDHLKKLLALFFRFSLIDDNFNIYVNGDRVSLDDLSDLIQQTEFAWVLNRYDDEFMGAMRSNKTKFFQMNTPLAINGFIASVTKPRHLKIAGTEERATIDLFVNGRLREKDILRHIPTQRVVESYLYGQIHFDSMDAPGKDPFTSSREGVIEDDENFSSLLDYLKREALQKIFDMWDENRLLRGDGGDEENPRKTKKSRKARDLYAATIEDYELDSRAPEKDKVDEWLTELQDDAEFNFESYSDCFVSENLVRKYIESKGLTLSPGVKKESDDWRQREADRKGAANLSFTIRKIDSDLSYLSMDALAVTVEGKKDAANKQSLWRDAVSYAPVRNVIGHTGLLTDSAKSHLRLTYENIRARVKALVSGKAAPP